MWVSEPVDAKQPEWIQLNWQGPVTVSEIHLTFNDDVNEYLINLHHHLTPFDVIPELIKDYQIQVLEGERWETVVRVKDNRRRKRVHKLAEAVTGTSLRVVVEATNGCQRAELIEVRVYE